MTEPTKAPQSRWQSAGTGWANMLLVSAVGIACVVAPIVLILALAFGWGSVTVLVAAVVTVLVWGGIALLLGPVYRRVNRKQTAAVPTEIEKLPELAQRYGLSYVEHSDALTPTLGRRWTSQGHCRHVLSGLIGGHPTAICWYERTEAGTELANLVLVMELPVAMPKLEVEAKMATLVAPGLHRRLPVQFEDNDFNDRYAVLPDDSSAESQRYAVDLISQRGIDWLLSVQPFDFDIQGPLLAVDGSAVLAEDEVQTLLDRAVILGHLVDAVPEFAWEQYGSPAQPLAGLA
ncbi:MAG TPA: hypothetical protein VHX59_07465 [Mycobacteriales bacterium]|nr:hypothetical protein [Mycobacteriales bacterium]